MSVSKIIQKSNKEDFIKFGVYSLKKEGLRSPSGITQEIKRERKRRGGERSVQHL